jgi:hypothetical protein
MRARCSITHKFILRNIEGLADLRRLHFLHFTQHEHVGHASWKFRETISECHPKLCSIHQSLCSRLPFDWTQIVVPTLIDELVRHLIVEELQVGEIRLPAKFPEKVANLVFQNSAQPSSLGRLPLEIAISTNGCVKRLLNKIFGYLRTPNPQQGIPIETVAVIVYPEFRIHFTRSSRGHFETLSRDLIPFGIQSKAVIGKELLLRFAPALTNAPDFAARKAPEPTNSRARMMHPARGSRTKRCARVYRVLFHLAWRMIRRTTASEAMSRVTIMRMPPSTDFAPPPRPRCRGSPPSRRRRARDAVSAARAALARGRRSQD